VYHTGMKVAISIPEEILNEVEGLTKEFGCSRSRVFAIAVEELLKRRRTRGLLQALNEAYEDDTPEETEVKRRSKGYHARKVQKEPC
jgi:Arc/MetJ-type ribon-helix-helix transcriptional regulator